MIRCRAQLFVEHRLRVLAVCRASASSLLASSAFSSSFSRFRQPVQLPSFRLLCVDDVLRCATALTITRVVAGGVVEKVWSAEQARAGRVQHFLKQLLHDSWDYAADHSGRLTVGIRRAVAYATTTSQSAALE